MSSNIEFVNTALNGGFLSGFVEASVEKPADGLNGNEITTENVERVNGERIESYYRSSRCRWPERYG